MKWIFRFLLAVVLIAAIVFLAGPRTPVDTQIMIDRSAIEQDPEAWIAAHEAEVAGVKPGQQKEIVWAYPASKARTPLAIVYVHGFSASKAEIRPVPDLVAKALGANLFYTRLSGHGVPAAALATVTVNDYVNDYAEAVAIGEAIGERVVIVATSTGASLAVWAASRPGLSQKIAGLVLVSPNFGLQADGSFLLTQPWATRIAGMIVGPERSFDPINEKQAEFWTTRYPSAALPPMAELAKLARDAMVQRIRIPALFIWSPLDTVVDPALTERKAAQWGAPHETLMLDDAGDAKSHHVVAGDIVSPQTTQMVADKAIAWIRALGR